MVEHERAYVFSNDSLGSFIDKHQVSLIHLSDIHDSYLSSDCRIRCEKTNTGDPAAPTVDSQYSLVRKEGDKGSGHRFEEEELISSHLAEILKTLSKLEVVKSRHSVVGNIDNNNLYKITVDIVSEPLKVSILEVEADDPLSMPIPLDISQRLFGEELRECPLCAWKYFNRKIGICGGPSSGKTESSKWLSFQINTRFGGNAFHVAEYATTFIQKYNRHPEFNDQILVWYGQWKRELNAKRANLVISDCPTFLSYIYAKILHDGPFNEQDALMLAKIYKQSLFDVNSYSDIILMQMRGYTENNIRYQSEAEACAIHERIQIFLDDHNIPYQSHSYLENEDMLNELLYLN